MLLLHGVSFLGGEISTYPLDLIVDANKLNFGSITLHFGLGFTIMPMQLLGKLARSTKIVQHSTASTTKDIVYANAGTNAAHQGTVHLYTQ